MTATITRQFTVAALYDGDEPLSITVSAVADATDPSRFAAGMTVTWVLRAGYPLRAIRAGADLRTPAGRTADPAESALALAAFIGAEGEHLARATCAEGECPEGYCDRLSAREQEVAETYGERLGDWAARDGDNEPYEG